MDRSEKSAEKSRTEKTGKKRYLLAVVLAAVLFITPLVVYAALYLSNERKNEFKPGAVDIEISEKEGAGGTVNEGERLSKTFNWVKDEESYKASKIVQIKDSRKYAGEELRVCFVPMWVDGDGNVCNVFNFGTGIPEITDGNKLVYKDGPGETKKTITLVLSDNWSAEGWVYDTTDGYFYYEGELKTGKLTPVLLTEVILNQNAYNELAGTYTLQLDVLADAIQRSGDAKHERGWTTSDPEP